SLQEAEADTSGPVPEPVIEVQQHTGLHQRDFHGKAPTQSGSTSSVHPVKARDDEVVEVSDSESYPPGFERCSRKEAGINVGKLIDQECCQLRSKEEVDSWVNGVIGSFSKHLGLSSTMGDQAVKSFFLKLGYAKLNERKNRELNEDEREMENYELCNEELTGDKIAYV
ncbi:hypothetical protein FRX31_026424, partial [Thalictrum thalictroides]